MSNYKIAISDMRITGKISDGDPRWGQFTGSFRNRQLDEMDIADQVYQGYAITAWHKNNWRATQNFLLAQHIGLDFDTADERSSIDFLLRDDFVAKYGAFLYTTPSHTDAAPKSRVIFLLDKPIEDPARYTQSVIALMWLFSGITVPDRKCKDPCRFFYGSKDCSLAFVHGVLPVDLLNLLIKQHADAGALQKKAIVKEYRPSNADEREVADALNVIPAMTIDYDEWLYCMMAIHHHFGDAGLALAERWGESYEGEAKKLWRYFKAEGNGGSPITIKYVFKQAGQRGWKWDRQKGQRAQ